MEKQNNEIHYYRLELTGRMIPRDRVKKGKREQYFEPEKKKVFFNEEQVQGFSLDRYGMPLHSKINSYTTVENYFIDFWGAIMGCEATYLFILLIRYRFGEDEFGNKKDYAFPELETLAEKMKKDVQTVKKYLEVLEDHYFIYRFWRLSPEENNKNKSIYYKMRASIPYLSEEQIMTLSPKLRSQHDRFLRTLMNKYDDEIILPESYNFTEEYQKIMSTGRPEPMKKWTLEDLNKYNEIREATIEKRITETDRQIWNKIMEVLSSKVAKESLKTWFGDSKCIMNETTGMTIYSPNSFSADWVRNRYTDQIKSAFQLIQGNELVNLNVETIFLNTPPNEIRNDHPGDAE